MTKQEVFDIVATHLLTQNRQALDEDSCICVYHASNGDKCAIGCLIPEELYMPKFEWEDVAGLYEQYLFCPPGINLEVVPMSFLSRLQDIHDFNVLEEWFFCLEDFGLEEGLLTDCLEPFRHRIDKLTSLVH